MTGYIGKSRHPDVTYDLITACFREIESRGTDAAGFWGTEPGDNGKILYHKEPGKSSEFVKNEVWQKVSTFNPNLFLAHARGASTGSGNAWKNFNNHPFVSVDRTIGLVHNGKIPEQEYDTLKKKYEVQSECDSEIILRMFEACEKSDEHKEYEKSNGEIEIASRLSSLHNIWSQVVKGAMAVGIGERLPAGNRRLWLFRNHYRPIWLIDLRKTLGQIFFCSTPDIWMKAATSVNSFRPFMRKRIKLIELPAEEVWVFNTSDANPLVDNSQISKFEVVSDGFKSVEYTGPAMAIVKRPLQTEVFTNLEEDDTLDKSSSLVKKKNLSSRHSGQTSSVGARTRSYLNVLTSKTTTNHGTDGSTDSIKAETVDNLANVARGEFLRQKKGENPLFFAEAPAVNEIANSVVESIYNDADYIYEKKPVNGFFEPETMDDYGYNDEEFNLIKICDFISKIKDCADEIEVTVMNLRQECSLTTNKFEELKEGLEALLQDLSGTKVLLES